MCKDSKRTCRTTVLLNLLFGNVPLPSPSWFAKIGQRGRGQITLEGRKFAFGKWLN